MKKTVHHIITISLIFCFSGIQTTGFSQNNLLENKTQKVYLLGHAHMDPVYRWRWNEIENREIEKTFSDVLLMLDKHPDLQFAQSYLLYYATIQQKFPETFAKVKQKIAEKRWSVVGGQWVETDETLPSGESLIRQFLIARDYYTKNLGIENIDIAWLPDVFTGHPGTLPKIYSGCGIKTWVFSREAPADERVFWWESRDGSRMLAYKIPGHYNPNFRQLASDIKNWKEISGYEFPLVTFGKGDHGGGPGESDLRAIKRLEENTNLRFEHISAEDYFKKLRSAIVDWPVQNTEFGYQPNGGRWLGCYTSQARIKKLNRFYENQLLSAEKFAALGTAHKGKPFYPREDFAEAWKILLFNQFHDIIPGTLTGLGVNDVYRSYNRLGEITGELLNYGLENIGNRINTLDFEGTPLVVYNPHSWPVSQLVEAKLHFAEATPHFKILAPKDEEIQYALSEQSNDGLTATISLDTRDVPPLGFRAYRVVPEKTEVVPTDLKRTGNTLENQFYIIKYDATGITSIFSKKLGKEMLKGTGNTLSLLEDNGSTWSLDLTGKSFEIKSLNAPEVVYEWPLKITVEWNDVFQESGFTRRMTLTAGSEQIDFEMEADWHGANKLLRVGFDTNIENGEATYEEPYGYAVRPQTGLDFPMQNWVDLSNHTEGISLLNNGKHGCAIKDGVMQISVVRGARDMDPRMDEGKHSFRYSFIAHKGNWRDANTVQKALELNQPLLSRQETHHPGPISGWALKDESFPAEKSFFGINSDHVIITSLKTRQDAYDPNPLVLRIVETDGRDETVTVNLPYEPRSVQECNHLEIPIEPRSKIETGEKQFTFEMEHDQIRTFIIQF